MPAHMSFFHILGTRILIIIMRSNFTSLECKTLRLRSKDSNLRFKDNSLMHRVNSFKCKTLRLRSKDS